MGVIGLPERENNSGKSRYIVEEITAGNFPTLRNILYVSNNSKWDKQWSALQYIAEFI